MRNPDACPNCGTTDTDWAYGDYDTQPTHVFACGTEIAHPDQPSRACDQIAALTLLVRDLDEYIRGIACGDCQVNYGGTTSELIGRVAEAMRPDWRWIS